MFHTNSISVTSIILQMKSISPPALPILITAGFPIWSINGVEHPEPDLKLENSGHTTTSNPTVITFMQTQGPSPTQCGLKKWDLCALFFFDAGIDLENCLVQFTEMLMKIEERWLCPIQMSFVTNTMCEHHRRSSPLFFSFLLPGATIANHCVFHKFKL